METAKLLSHDVSGSIWDVSEFLRTCNKRTLIVMDFDGTIVSKYQHEIVQEIQPRPYLQKFLRDLCKDHMMIGFSAACPERSSFILFRFLWPLVKFVIPNSRIVEGKKKVDDLEEKFEKVIIIKDNIRYVESSDKTSVIEVGTWKGWKNDETLKRCIERIQRISKK
jgi:hypothetical protein